MAKAGYEVRISETMLRLGYFRNSDMAWEVVSIVNNSHGNGTCQLCGHRPIRYEFTIRNQFDGQELVVGSECVNNVDGINPRQAQYALDVFKDEVAKEKKAAAEKKAEELKAEYKTKYATEIAFLANAMAKNIWLGAQVWEANKILTTGKGKLKDEHLEAVKAFMETHPVIKSKQEELEEAAGGTEALEEMTQYVLTKHDQEPDNDFWASIWRGLDVNQYLSEKQIAAVKRSMEKEKTQQATSKFSIPDYLQDSSIPF